MKKSDGAGRRDRARQAALAHALRKSSIDLLAATVVHDLSQPVTAINAWASMCVRLMQNDAGSRDRVIEGLKVIEQEARRATDELRRFRDVWCNGGADETPIDLNAVLTETAAILGDEARELGATIGLELGKAPPVCADRDLMALVIAITCRNGLDAMRDAGAGGRTLTLRSFASGDAARVEIADTGPGVAEDTVARLFTPARSTKKDGLGIGLAISQSIIKSLGGRMWLASNSCEGATFAFELPGTQGMQAGGMKGGTAEG